MLTWLVSLKPGWMAEGVNVSDICCPDFLIHQQSNLRRQVGSITMIYRKISPDVLHSSHQVLSCLHMMLDDQGKVGLLLVYSPPLCCPTVSMMELEKAFSSWILQVGSSEGPLRRYMISQLRTCALHVNHGPVPDDFWPHTWVGVTLWFGCSVLTRMLGIWRWVIIPLSWTDFYLVGFRLTGTQFLSMIVGPTQGN